MNSRMTIVIKQQSPGLIRGLSGYRTLELLCDEVFKFGFRIHRFFSGCTAAVG